ncbi:MAG TPA: PD-(D/E)XK nuclease-like domain-containing protein [Polyangiaceae bacterium]
MEAKPGLYLDVPETEYHADQLGDDRLSLSVSIAQALVLESPAHAYLRHPRLGGQPLIPSNDMDRGSLIHALVLGKGRKVAIVECENWTKKKDKAQRDEMRAAGYLAVTRAMYEDSVIAAAAITRKLEKRSIWLNGDSEVTIVWDETTSDGATVRCRSRMDHIAGNNIYDLKIGDANPKRFRKGHLTSMGYDIQGAAYPRALEAVDPRTRGRAVFRLLFCEPEPPYCITPVRFSGTLRELGNRRWQRGIDRWDACLSSGVWGDYTDSEVVAEARPWELEEEADEGETDDAA